METVGKGSFASVYKVVRKSDNKMYALKRVKINKMSKKEISDALNEIRFLASVRHKNIVGFLEAFLENNETELCIIMEYCGCGDLAQKVERYKRRKTYIDEDVIWRYLIQSLKALTHLHEKGICHRDLKTANSFIAEDGSIKIGDMNVSKRLKKGHLQTQIGTPYYMSPEIWNNRPYDSSSDIWSLGCMIYELCTLRPPFLGDSFPSLKRAVVAGRYNPLPRKYSDALSRVIGLMLRVNPKERLSADAFLRSADFSPKLVLDEISHFVPKQEACDLMETIKVPGNLRQLNCALPKPCYPDVRPNSPSAWICADQKQNRARPPPIPEEHIPVSGRDDSSVSSHSSAVSNKSNYSKASIQSNQENIPSNRMPMPDNLGLMKPKYHPNLAPIPSDAPNSNGAAGAGAAYPYSKIGRPTPLMPVVPTAPNMAKPAGNPARVQAHRMW